MRHVEFNRRANLSFNLQGMLRAGNYKAAHIALNACSARQRKDLLNCFFHRNSVFIITNQKPDHFRDASFLDYLVQKDDRTLIGVLAKTAPDAFRIQNSDILFIIYRQKPDLLDVVFKNAPSTERDFRDTLSEEQFMVQAELIGHANMGWPGELSAMAETWLPRRDIQALKP